MNQGKWRNQAGGGKKNIDILGISELKWKGMG